MLNNAQMFARRYKYDFGDLITRSIIHIKFVVAFEYLHHFLTYFWQYFSAPLGQVSITRTTVATSTSSGMIHGLRFRLKSFALPRTQLPEC
ncbi:hypothetical protein CKO_04240 [Citrobacter koseri ATCC BAA-895]|uniref:Uncharacterized protein n=1 Tax=Citrobacter koseri (strain ATCC BAA-895 / CDC 4225-83 / SGSC4696) TaxID=290338 RepID=A8AP87_CITK8|nr:hypothetical protein CKO_04240 [Citrobacter koseri ATCC BAA-895]